jgi:undecaprenyl pyrophosphate phosphatase UppP
LWCHPDENYNKLGLCISIILFFLSKAYNEYNNIIEKDNSANKYKNFKMLLNLLMCGVIIVGLYIHNNVKDENKSKNLLLGWFVIILLYLLISSMKDFNEYSYSNNNSLYDRNFLDGLINLIIFVVLSLRYLSDIGLNVKKEDVLL